MKLNNIYISGLLALSLIGGATSCSDNLDLKPIDNYGSENYWQNEAQVTSYINGIHSNLRSLSWLRTVSLGELRSGIYAVGGGADGSSLSAGDVISQNLSEDKPGVSNFGGFYGPILNISLFIQQIEKVQIAEAKKNYYLGQAYGIRALYYFDLYRTYGTVPIRTTPDVVNGNIDPNTLSKPRAAASEVMKQIKADLDKSLEYFGTVNTFDAYSPGGKKSFWNKAATETLKGEVYLWNAKVTVGDQAATPADLATAKTALLSVLNNYGLSLESNFAQIFSNLNKGNKEIIFASRFVDGEATNGNIGDYTYRSDNGIVINLYKSDGTKFGDALEVKGTGMLRYQYKNELFNLFDATDKRRAATFEPAYQDAAATTLAVAIPKKNLGEINAQGNRVYTSDVIHYRLADVILMLAEVANMEGNNSDVEKYINMIRTRAYGENSHNYAASDFKTNELAILTERTKEFVQEGKRWYDLIRMQTAASGGSSLVFDAAATIDGSTTPILNKATEAYKVLWPINVGLNTNDPAIKQTPGYKTAIKE